MPTPFIERWVSPFYNRPLRRVFEAQWSWGPIPGACNLARQTVIFCVLCVAADSRQRRFVVSIGGNSNGDVKCFFRRQPTTRPQQNPFSFCQLQRNVCHQRGICSKQSLPDVDRIGQRSRASGAAKRGPMGARLNEKTVPSRLEGLPLLWHCGEDTTSIGHRPAMHRFLASVSYHTRVRSTTMSGNPLNSTVSTHRTAAPYF